MQYWVRYIDINTQKLNIRHVPLRCVAGSFEESSRESRGILKLHLVGSLDFLC